MAELEDDDGWTTLGGLGNQLQKVAPDFDACTYGASKLSALIEKLGGFELDRKAQPIRLRMPTQKAR